VPELIGERPVVLEWEFSYAGLLEALEAAGMRFVIRLNTGTRPIFTEGKKWRLYSGPLCCGSRRFCWGGKGSGGW
jgi:hypothetical protein